MQILRTACRALVLLFASTSAAPAQIAGPSGDVQLKRLTLEQLGEVVVTSVSKEPERVGETAAAIYVITQADIRRSGATTLPDVLRLAPGVIVSQSDANRWAVGIRGLADIFSKSVLVMIDGRSVYTPLVGGVHWAIQDVLLADVEQIEVIRGPGGSLWGANAVNGIINVITRTAGATQGPRLDVAAGTVEHGRASARYGGALGESVRYRVYAQGFDRGAQFHADGNPFDEWRSAQAGFRTDWERSKGSRISLSGDLYSTRVGERAQVSFYAPPSISDVDGTLDLTGGNVLLRWDRLSARGTRIRLQTYYDHTNRDGFTFRESRSTVDGDFNMRLPARGRHQLAWGLGARRSPSTVMQTVPTLNFLPNQGTSTILSGFVQDDLNIIDRRLSVSLGTKLEANNYTGWEILPSGRLLWTIGPRHSAWAAVTRSVRTPSRFERDLRFEVLVDPGAPVYLGVRGSSAFDSETLLGTEVGYRQLVSPNVNVDVAVFNNTYGGLAGLGEPTTSFEATPVPHVLAAFPFVNGVDATTRGFEIAPEWKPLPTWQLKGSYSYLHLTAENRPGFTNTALRDNYRGQSPSHQVRVQSRIDLPGAVEADHSYRFVSALPSLRVPAYQTLDARLAWRPTPRIELSLIGQNLLQPRHAEFNAVGVEIRRSAYVGLTWTR